MMLAPIMPHLSEEAFHYSYLKKQHPNGLFRSELKLEVEKKWLNEDIKKLFEVVSHIREEVNEKIGSNNPALYELELECEKKDVEMFENANFGDSAWLNEIFGCANVKLSKKMSSENEFRSRTPSGVMYQLGLSKIDTTRQFACVRCRRYVCRGEEEKSKSEEEICERCRGVINM